MIFFPPVLIKWYAKKSHVVSLRFKYYIAENEYDSLNIKGS